MSESFKIGKKVSGAWLTRHALEQLPISHTFGIPGVHNTELYDELYKSEKIEPVLVTHEGGGSFIADAISRTGGGRIGVLNVVPAAGITHAMSGIGEAFLDGIPMLILSGGVRIDGEFGYQLHELDQVELLRPLTKAAYRIERHEDIVPTIFEAYTRAVTGVPGPTFVEIPYNVALFQQKIDSVPVFVPPAIPALRSMTEIDEAVALLRAAKQPGIFVGWGAVDVSKEIAEIAERLGAPVATTLQGLSSFPGAHPLHTGMGFSPAAVPAATKAFDGCDCMLAVGVRFAEIPTGSYGCTVPENLIHIDIDPEVPGRNYPAKLKLIGDSRAIVPALRDAVRAANIDEPARREAVSAEIAKNKAAYKQEWADHAKKSDRVNPSFFFDELRKQLDDDAITVVDDGNHTFLAAELFEVKQPRSFISPTDFNCMGYAVPAAIGAKIANPDRQVVSIVGDGAFLMTCMEILTASTEGAGVAYFVFYDGELSQISQGQEIPYNRKTATILGNVQLEGIAHATGARYVPITSNDGLAAGIREALATTKTGQPVIVDVRIDYSKRTRFTKGIVGTVLKRFPLGDKVRFIGRAVIRKVTG